MPSLPGKEKYLSISQTAKFLHVSIDTVRRWDKAGTIKSTRLDGKDRYFLKEELEAFAQNKGLSPSAAARHLGVSLSTLRRYEKKNLVSSKRNSRGERVYDRENLNASKVLQKKGATLSPFQYNLAAEKKYRHSEGANAAQKVTISSRVIPAAQSQEEITEEKLETKYTFLKKLTYYTFVGDHLRNLSFFSSLNLRKRVLIAGISFTIVLASSFFVYTNFKDYIRRESSQLSEEQIVKPSRQVLAASASSLKGTLNINIPSLFNSAVGLKNDLAVSGTSTFEGDVIVKGTKLDLGSAKINAGNIVYSVTAGDGIKVEGTQTPKITNTGVTSFQSKTGAITLEAGTGITIDGVKISSSVTASNTFKTVKVGSDSFSAGSSTDTLEFVAGTGITLSNDTSNKKVTITGSATSGFTDDGTVVRLTTSTDSVGIGTTSPAGVFDVGGGSLVVLSGGNVGIGTTAPLEKLSLVGNATFSGNLTFSSTPTLAARNLSQLTIGDSQTGNILLSPASTKTVQFFSSSNYIDSSGNLYLAGNLITSTGGAGGSGTVGFFQRANGTIAPTNITDDLVLGATATASAKFAVINIAGGTPTASISAGTTGGVYLDASGKLATTAKQTLTLGDTTTTGNIILNPAGNIGINTTNPSSKLYIDGATVIAPSTNGTTTSLTVRAANGSSGNILNITNTAGTTSYLSISNTGSLTVNGSTLTNAGLLESAGAIHLTGASNTVIATAITNGWTNVGGNSYTYRHAITVTNNDSNTLSKMYEITYTFSSGNSSHIYSNTQNSSYANNQVKDMRLFYGSTEVPMYISSFTSSNVTIKFRVSSAISASSSDTYYLYYSNSSISTTASTYTPVTRTLLDDVTTTTCCSTSVSTTQWYTSDNSNFTLAQDTTTSAPSGSGGDSTSGKITATQATGVANVGSWNTQTNLPAVRDKVQTATATVGGTPYIYIYGGYSTTTIRATLDTSTGNISSYNTASQATIPSGQINNSDGAYLTTGSGTFMYLIGGTPNGNLQTPSTAVYKATVDGSGNIPSWTQESASLPAGRSMTAAVVAYAGSTPYLYVIGGTSNNALWGGDQQTLSIEHS